MNNVKNVTCPGGPLDMLCCERQDLIDRARRIEDVSDLIDHLQRKIDWLVALAIANGLCPPGDEDEPRYVGDPPVDPADNALAWREWLNEI